MTRVWMLDAATKNYPLACAWMGWFFEDGYRNGRPDVEQSTRTTIQAPPAEVPFAGGVAGGFAAGLANGLAKRKTTIDTKSRTDVLSGPQYTEAMNWYRRAADQNEPKSMYAIGRFHERGFGVPLNIDLAMKWYAIRDGLRRTPGTRVSRLNGPSRRCAKRITFALHNSA